MKNRWRAFSAKYPQVWLLSYFALYLPWFFWLENRGNRPYHVIHTPLDDYIPFCEYFIIPYFLWFGYVALVYGWLFFHDRKQFLRHASFLYGGMTLFLILSTVYPNGHLLRPLEFDRDNLFIQMVCFLYWADTSTNILPSIHVFNSLAAHLAVTHTPGLRKKKWTVWCSRLLCGSIILSTMFLKQHSCFDVLLGVFLAQFFHWAVYHSGLSVKAHHLVGQLVGHHRDLSPSLSGKIHGAAKNSKV